MQPIARFLVTFALACLIFLLGVSQKAHAQIQWTAPHVIDTGWFTPNIYGHTPDNEPTSWSHPVLVPFAPDGADLVRIQIEEVKYAGQMTCTNLSPIGWISYLTTGTYDYHIGHKPGLYAESSANCAVPQWLVGHGWDTNAMLAAKLTNARSGGSGFFRSVEIGATTTEDLISVDNGGPLYPVIDDIMPMAPAWLEPSRRDPTKHALWVTAEGGYSTTWYVHNSEGGMMPPEQVAAMFSHLPWSYSLTPRVSLRATVRYGSYP